MSRRRNWASTSSQQGPHPMLWSWMAFHSWCYASFVRGVSVSPLTQLVLCQFGERCVSVSQSTDVSFLRKVTWTLSQRGMNSSGLSASSFPGSWNKSFHSEGNLVAYPSIYNPLYRAIGHNSSCSLPEPCHSLLRSHSGQHSYLGRFWLAGRVHERTDIRLHWK